MSVLNPFYHLASVALLLCITVDLTHGEGEVFHNEKALPGKFYNFDSLPIFNDAKSQDSTPIAYPIGDIPAQQRITPPPGWKTKSPPTTTAPTSNVTETPSTTQPETSSTNEETETTTNPTEPASSGQKTPPPPSTFEAAAVVAQNYDESPKVQPSYSSAPLTNPSTTSVSYATASVALPNSFQPARGQSYSAPLANASPYGTASATSNTFETPARSTAYSAPPSSNPAPVSSSYDQPRPTYSAPLNNGQSASSSYQIAPKIQPVYSNPPSIQNAYQEPIKLISYPSVSSNVAPPTASYNKPPAVYSAPPVYPGSVATQNSPASYQQQADRKSPAPYSGVPSIPTPTAATYTSVVTVGPYPTAPAPSKYGAVQPIATTTVSYAPAAAQPTYDSNPPSYQSPSATNRYGYDENGDEITTVAPEIPSYSAQRYYKPLSLGVGSELTSVWTTWSTWSICREGSQMRVRGCYTYQGFQCSGPRSEDRGCNTETGLPLEAQEKQWSFGDAGQYGGQQQQQFGSQYGVPNSQPSYSQPPPSYQPQPAAPVQQYNQPSPQTSYSNPSPPASYNQPIQASTPSPSYNQPKPSPSPSYGNPSSSPSYNNPSPSASPSYNQPTPPPSPIPSYNQQNANPPASYSQPSQQPSYSQPKPSSSPSYSNQSPSASYNNSSPAASYNQPIQQPSPSPSYSQPKVNPPASYNQPSQQPSYSQPSQQPSYSQPSQQQSYNQPAKPPTAPPPSYNVAAPSPAYSQHSYQQPPAPTPPPSYQSAGGYPSASSNVGSYGAQPAPYNSQAAIIQALSYSATGPQDFEKALVDQYWASQGINPSGVGNVKYSPARPYEYRAPPGPLPAHTPANSYSSGSVSSGGGYGQQQQYRQPNKVGYYAQNSPDPLLLSPGYGIKEVFTPTGVVYGHGGDGAFSDGYRLQQGFAPGYNPNPNQPGGNQPYGQAAQPVQPADTNAGGSYGPAGPPPSLTGFAPGYQLASGVTNSYGTATTTKFVQTPSFGPDSDPSQLPAGAPAFIPTPLPNGAKKFAAVRKFSAWRWGSSSILDSDNSRGNTNNFASSHDSQPQTNLVSFDSPLPKLHNSTVSRQSALEAADKKTKM